LPWSRPPSSRRAWPADCRSEDLVLTQRGRECTSAHRRRQRGRWLPARASSGSVSAARTQSWFGSILCGKCIHFIRGAGRARAHAGSGACHWRSCRHTVRRVHFGQENELIRLNRCDHEARRRSPTSGRWPSCTHADPEPFTFKFDLPDLSRAARRRRRSRRRWTFAAFPTSTNRTRKARSRRPTRRRRDRQRQARGVAAVG
jgi:hypothetical protein